MLGISKDNLIYGVGYMGVGMYSSRINGDLVGSYKAWKSMLQRCYSPKVQEKYRTYVDCTVVEEWYNYQNFAEWYEINYKEGYHLDKDLLVVGNKVYSPVTCVFVPQNINGFLTDCNNTRGVYAIGVSYTKGAIKKPYRSRVSSGEGKALHLGYYATEKEAHTVWVEKKLSLAKGYKEIMDSIDKTIYPNVCNMIKLK